MLEVWLINGGFWASVEPTPLGEFILIAGAVVIGGIILGQVIVEEVSDMLDGVFEDNTETTTTDSNEEKKGKKPSRPGKMQEEVKKIKIWLRKHNWSTEIKIFD